MATLTVSAKGWVVIPKDLREKYGLSPGRRVAVVDYAGVLGIVPVPADPIEELSTMFAGRGEAPWTVELVKEHRQEHEREERRAG